MVTTSSTTGELLGVALAAVVSFHKPEVVPTSYLAAPRLPVSPFTLSPCIPFKSSV